MKSLFYWLLNFVLGIIIIIGFNGYIKEKNIFFLITVIIFVSLLILNIKKYNNEIANSRMIKNLDERYLKNNWQKIGNFQNSYLYVNENDKKISTNGREFEFKDLVSAELLEDENTYTNGYAIGGSGNSFYGASRQTKYCTKLQIKLVLNSITEPQTYITFLNKRTLKSGKKYRQAYDMAQKFLSTFKVITKNSSN